jgi:hypothetical protein
MSMHQNGDTIAVIASNLMVPRMVTRERFLIVTGFLMQPVCRDRRADLLSAVERTLTSKRMKAI